MRVWSCAICLAIIVMAIAADRTYGGERVILLTGDEVTATAGRDSTSAKSYLVTVPMPEGVVIDRIHRVLLEFYANVFGLDSEEYESESALVEVYAVSDPVVGDVNAKQQRVPSAMSRNVIVGDNQRVLVDITEILRYNMTEGLEVCTLLIGVVRDRDGVFRLREDGFGAGKPARVTIVERPADAH